MGHLAVIVTEGGDGTAGEGRVAGGDEGRVETVEGLRRSVDVGEDKGHCTRGGRGVVDATFVVGNEVGHGKGLGHFVKGSLHCLLCHVGRDVGQDDGLLLAHFSLPVP